MGTNFFLLLFLTIFAGDDFPNDCAFFQAIPIPANSESLPVSILSENKLFTVCPQNPCPGKNTISGEVRNTGTANGGPFAVTGVKVSGLLATGMTFLGGSVSQGSVITGMNGMFTINIGSMAPNQIVSFSFMFNGTGMSDQVNLTLTQDQFNPGSMVLSHCQLEYVQCSDVEVSKTASLDSVNLGETFDFNLCIKNNGPDIAKNAKLIDDFLTVFEIIEFTSGSGCQINEDDNRLQCNVGDIAPGDSICVIVKAKGIVSGRYPNVASGFSDSNDIFLPNNTSDTVRVTFLDTIADVAVMKSANLTDVKVGDPVTFTIVVKNNGPQPAMGVKLFDELPVYPDVISGGGIPNFDLELVPQGCTFSNHEIMCDIGTLARGEERVYTVTGFAQAEKNLHNFANVTSTGPSDPYFNNNGAYADVHVIGDVNSSEGNPNGGTGADPVSTFTGEYFFEELNDFYLKGPIDFHFDRYYASFLHSSSYPPASMGLNWSHTFDWRLVHRGDFIEIYDYKGQVFAFEQSGNEWTRLNGNKNFQLLQNGADFLFANIDSRAIYIFNSSGLLRRIESMNGQGVDLTYQNNKLQSVQDGLGRNLLFNYNPEGLLSQVSDGIRTVMYEYLDSLLISFTNTAGQITRYEYDSTHPKEGLMKSRILPGNQNSTHSQEYNLKGQVENQTDAYQQISHFTYNGPITSVTDPLNYTALHEHNINGQQTSYTDAAGNAFSCTFGDEGRRMSVTDQNGELTEIKYEPESGLINAIETSKQSIHITYRKFLIKGLNFFKPDTIVYTSGLKSVYTYDDVGNLIMMTNRSGDNAVFEYNSRGQMIKSFSLPDSLGKREITYDTSGMIASIKTGDQDSIAYAYDANFRLNRINFPDGSFRSIEYDALDHILSITDESGQTLTYDYNEDGKVIAIRHSSGTEVGFEYDKMLREDMLVDPAGDTIRFGYDGDGNLVVFNDMLGHPVYLTYDHRNLPTSISRGGLNYNMEYDPTGVLESIRLPSGRKMNYTIDGEGLITSISIENATIAELQYNDNGRITSLTLPSGYGYSLGYDGRGSLSSISLPENIGTHIENNAFGQPIQITDPNGGQWTQRTDDQLRIIEEENPLGQTLAYSYNERGQINHIEGSGISMDLGYTASGYPSSMIYSDGTTLQYQYDDMGRIVETNGLAVSYDAKGDVNQSNGIRIDRNAEGMITKLKYTDDFYVDYLYDNLGRLEEVSDVSGNSITFTYSPDGDVESISRSNGIRTSMMRDEMNRVTSLTDIGNDTLSFVQVNYDEDSRVIGIQRSANILPDIKDNLSAYTYNAAHQIGTFEYDAIGNVTQDDQRMYQWNQANQLLHYLQEGKTITFAYDGFGNRISRSDEQGEKSFSWLYGLDIPQPAILKSGKNIMQYYVYTPYGDLLYAVDVNTGSASFYHFDERGNTSFLSNTAGEILCHYAYSPYGLSSYSGQDPVGWFTFGGQYGSLTEQGKNLYLMHRRYYDAATIRFLSGDPNENRVDPRMINPYTYALQSPMNYIDKLGYEPQPVQEDGLSLDGANVAGTGAFVTNIVSNGIDINLKMPVVPKNAGEVFEVIAGYTGAPSSWSKAGQLIKSGNNLSRTGLNAANQGFAHYFQSYIQQAQSQFAKAAKWKSAGKIAGAGGTALTIYSIFKTLKGTNANINKNMDPFIQTLESFVNTEGGQIDELIRLLKMGKIGREEFEKRVYQIEGEMTNQIDQAWSDYYKNLVFEGLDGFIKSLEAFLPNPTDGSLSNGIYGLWGSDVSIFRQ